jgi:type I restriction enzyme M protein
MLTAETKRRIDACRDILVGKLPLPTDQVELITLALIYKFMDDLDEESVRIGGKRSYFTGPLEKYRWRALLPQAVSAEERMNLFARGMELLGGAEMDVDGKRTVPGEHLPALFRDIFRNSFLKFRDGRILTLFLNEVNAFEYSHSEELGNAFEYLLMSAGVQADNGQFRTPRHIIHFMVECIDPQPTDRILDPACGTAGFLVAAFTHILKQHTSSGSDVPGDQLTFDQRQRIYSNVTGYDITDLMVKLSKVNLFLHGFPDPAIHIYDTLTNDARWNDKADLMLANPPFMTPKGGISRTQSFASQHGNRKCFSPITLQNILRRTGAALLSFLMASWQLPRPLTSNSVAFLSKIRLFWSCHCRKECSNPIRASKRVSFFSIRNLLAGPTKFFF